MDTNDLRTYRLLVELESAQSLSQRELAKKLNISLGLVNSFIKRLSNKGYFKITTIPKNRVKYILTPKGAAEKTRLTYEYIQYSLRFYRDARRKLRRLFKRLEEKNVSSIVLCGVGELAEIAFISLHESRLKFVAIVDKMAIEDRFFKSKILPIERVNEIFFDAVIITAVGNASSLEEVLNDYGVPHEKVFRIF